MKKTVFVYILLFVLTSCGSKKKLFYFQETDRLNNSESTSYVPTLKPDDLLAITVSALDIESTLPFNPRNPYGLGSSNVSESVTTTNYRFNNYLIDNEGNIDFPVLGTIKLGGKTRTEAVEYIKTRLKKYIKDPSINIQILNFRITILGEVSRPGTYTLANEKITLLEALGLAGDMTIYGIRNDIMVIRENEGKKDIVHIDLTTDDIFHSSVYYLSQNDVVYIKPNGSKRNSSAYSPSISVFTSIAGIIISTISVITR